MESAKDFGFNDGYLLNKGSTPPTDHVVVGSVGDKQHLAFPTQLLDEEHGSYVKTIGKPFAKDANEFGKSYAVAKTIINSTGLTKNSTPQDVLVGVDFKGDRIYSNPKLANNKDTKSGRDIIETSGIALGAMGAFSDHKEASNFIGINSHVEDPKFHGKLDELKNKADPKGFIAAFGKVAADSKTDFTKYKLYENWNNLSPAQKAIGIAGVGIQGYKFADGNTFETKKITPEVLGVPSLNAAEGLELAAKGVNVAPATKNWAQLAAIQESIHTPRKAADVVNTSNDLGLLGHGTDGRAVPIDEKVMAKYNMNPVPHYGVGAVTIPAGQGLPTGYVKVKDVNGKQVVIPGVNKSSAVINVPDVASESAHQIYKNWQKPVGDKFANPVGDKFKPTKGTAGGSALVGGLSNMEVNNPYTLGVVMTHATYEHTSADPFTDDLSNVTGMAGITLQRIVSGGASKDIDKKGLAYQVPGEFTEENFSKSMKNIRGEYAIKGISSKEIGYQLTNQAYAEGRLNESQTVAAHKTIDMVFDDTGFNTAEKISTGKGKGIALVSKKPPSEKVKPSPRKEKPVTQTKDPSDTTDPDYDPSFDPKSPDYNPNKYRPPKQKAPTYGTEGSSSYYNTVGGGYGKGGGSQPAPDPQKPVGDKAPQGPGTVGVYERDSSGKSRLVIGRRPDGSPIFDDGSSSKGKTLGGVG